MRIIIVEDEPRALRGLRNLIESIGEEFEIIGEARDGNAALDLIVLLKPDVVFTDIKMPFMDGIILVEAVQKYDLKIRFVITSAYANFEYAKKAIALDVCDYLLKPLTYEEVEQTLKDLEKKIKKDSSKVGDIKLVETNYPEAHYMIQKAIVMIETGFATRLSQEDIANHLGMTQEYFSYLFHKEIGIKFSDYLRNYRIQVAQKLLLENNMKVQAVSSAVGYSDVKYFSKIFRKVTGVNPNEYQKNK